MTQVPEAVLSLPGAIKPISNLSVASDTHSDRDDDTVRMGREKRPAHHFFLGAIVGGIAVLSPHAAYNTVHHARGQTA